MTKGGKVNTLKAVKKHGTGTRSAMSMKMRRTLGSGDLRHAVKLPKGEEMNDWLAANTVDFFNEVSLMYGCCIDDARKFQKPGEGFPSGVEYRWLGKEGKPVRLSSPEYVDHAMSWIEAMLDTEEVFPVLESQDFPEDFINYIRDMYKKLFRIFAIMYRVHFDSFKSIEADAHLNTVFKHFMYFCFEFNLLSSSETKVLKSAVDKLRSNYEKK